VQKRADSLLGAALRYSQCHADLGDSLVQDVVGCEQSDAPEEQIRVMNLAVTSRKQSETTVTAIQIEATLRGSIMETRRDKTSTQKSQSRAAPAASVASPHPQKARAKR